MIHYQAYVGFSIFDFLKYQPSSVIKKKKFWHIVSMIITDLLDLRLSNFLN